jgi:hypothetical protein
VGSCHPHHRRERACGRVCVGQGRWCDLATSPWVQPRPPSLSRLGSWRSCRSSCPLDPCRGSSTSRSIVMYFLIHHFSKLGLSPRSRTQNSWATTMDHSGVSYGLLNGALAYFLVLFRALLMTRFRQGENCKPRVQLSRGDHVGFGTELVNRFCVVLPLPSSESNKRLLRPQGIFGPHLSWLQPPDSDDNHATEPQEISNTHRISRRPLLSSSLPPSFDLYTVPGYSNRTYISRHPECPLGVSTGTAEFIPSLLRSLSSWVGSCFMGCAGIWKQILPLR